MKECMKEGIAAAIVLLTFGFIMCIVIGGIVKCITTFPLLTIILLLSTVWISAVIWAVRTLIYQKD